MKNSFKKNIGIYLFVLFFSITVLHGICEAEVAIIPVHHRNATEVLPVVQGMLSPDGKVTFNDRIRSLVLTDSPASIQRISAFLQNFDAPVQQVKIQIKFGEGLSSLDRSVSARGDISGKNWQITNGKTPKNSIQIHADDANEYQKQKSEYVITTRSGSPAYIMTGWKIPYRQKWASLCRRYAIPSDTVEFITIETGLEILPLIVKDHASIEITPKISQIDSYSIKRGFRFTTASTQLRVPLGQWVDIGGTDKHKNEVLRAILESGTDTQQSTFTILLKVETF